MLRSLLARLSAPEPLPPADARLALAAILVRAARADDDYAAAEKTAIDQALAHRYSLTPAEAAALRAAGEAAEAEAVDLVRFTRLIKQAVPVEDRHGIMEALWRVILADETRDPDEDALARQAAHLLGVADRDSAIARNRAAHDLGLTP
jgi:uncharacterized tellurite resistance protein B-like protein